MTDTIKALSEGNHLVYEQLFDSVYESLCRYAYSILRDMDEAEDVVQKVFCKLWDQRETLSIQSSIKSYLYRIVHNDSINVVHQQINHKEHNFKYSSGLHDSEESAIETLKQRSWTGNIRELRNMVERLIILGGYVISREDIDMFG